MMVQKEYTEKLAQEYTIQAIRSIESLTNVNSDMQNAVMELTNLLLKRKN